MTSIVILTNTFPFPSGEQFLEDEIPYWAEADFDLIYILPANANGAPRPIPNNVHIDLCLTQSGRLERLSFIVKAMFSPIYLRELAWLIKSGKLRPYTCARSLIDAAITLQRAAKLTRFTVRQGGIDVAYCYWNQFTAYAAIMVKNQGLIGKVVSRAHGGDLYEERMRYHHLPLKRQFIQLFDRLFALSGEGKTYLTASYGVSADRIEISPLGVPLPRQLSVPSPPGQLHLVSVSFCVRVKRIDKIIEALALLADQEPTLSIHWTHIGDGPLLAQHKLRAEEKFAGKSNLTHEFKGNLSNKAVKSFYLSQPVDVFVNASESEGIPVSIMEAMSCGVPAVAPNIGGISFLVTRDCGALMSTNPSPEEIVEVLADFVIKAKKPDIRTKARKVIQERFNADRNYPDLIKRLHLIAGSGD